MTEIEYVELLVLTARAAQAIQKPEIAAILIEKAEHALLNDVKVTQ